MLSLLGIGCAHPATSISNRFLEELDVGTSAAWIEEKIGVLERVTTLPIEYIQDTRNSDPAMAAMVSKQSVTDLAEVAIARALEAAKIDSSDLGMVICSSCTPDTTVPLESQQIIERIKARAIAFDLGTACPSFALHVDFLNRFHLDQLPEYILGVCSAAYTTVVNYNDRTDGAIWGDGAAAYVFSLRKGGKLEVLDTRFESDPSRSQAVVIERRGHFHQDGRAVRDFSVRQTVRMLKRLEQDFQLDWTRDVFIGHQANRTMLEQVVSNRGIPPSNHWHNVTYLGNQAAAGAPAVLAEHWNDIRPGQKIVVAVLGAGLSWGSVLFQAR